MASLEMHTSAKSGSATESGKHSVRAAVIGVSGYAGGELARLLLRHPRFSSTPPHFFSRATEKEFTSQFHLSDLHPNLSDQNEDPVVTPFDWDYIEAAGIELMILATPHEQSRNLV